MQPSDNVCFAISPGVHEALELRDDDKSKYMGKSVFKAVDNINKIIVPELLKKVREHSTFFAKTKLIAFLSIKICCLVSERISFIWL